MATQTYDALVVGAGFGGIYQTHKLRELNLNVKLIEKGSDIGGTWYWNRYPGAMSDSESYLYRYSWDKQALVEAPWSQRYVTGPEILNYLRSVVAKHDLRKYMEFNTELIEAELDEKSMTWTCKTNTGTTIKCHYLIAALGLLNKEKLPRFAGIDRFKGSIYHTSKWPEKIDLVGQRIGVIGNGSTGVQLITALAKEPVKRLTSFQRSPQYCIPARNRAISPQERADIDNRWDEIWSDAKKSATAFGIPETSRLSKDVTDEERREIYEQAWQRGHSFFFMFSTFADITVDPVANAHAVEFIKSKIREMVKDPEKARKLIPQEVWARRPICEAGYYDQFNRDNVDIVNLRENGIVQFTESGVRMEDGTEVPLDIMVFATGFDAVTGSYTKFPIKGRGGKTIQKQWTEECPETYLGCCVAGYPNFFMIMGPNSPFANNPPVIETQVEFVTESIGRAQSDAAKSGGIPVVEATIEAQNSWTTVSNKASEGSLFREVPNSWIFGANITGKKFASLFYFLGLASFRAKLDDIKQNNWDGFHPLVS